jgi:phosphotransferase system  glucose/maltose/N-acetylglucosamine-specific IIC component
MDMIAQILLIILCVVVAFFAVTFLIYIFNLDMKMASKLLPWLDKHYDRVKRDKRL